MISDNPAFPRAYSETSHLDSVGLTKREYFAAMVIQGMMAHPGNLSTKEYAEDAVRVADALIAELSK